MALIVTVTKTSKFTAFVLCLLLSPTLSSPMPELGNSTMATNVTQAIQYVGYTTQETLGIALGVALVIVLFAGLR